jgi:hypothetical protein
MLSKVDILKVFARYQQSCTKYPRDMRSGAAERNVRLHNFRAHPQTRKRNVLDIQFEYTTRLMGTAQGLTLLISQLVTGELKVFSPFNVLISILILWREHRLGLVHERWPLLRAPLLPLHSRLLLPRHHRQALGSTHVLMRLRDDRMRVPFQIAT